MTGDIADQAQDQIEAFNHQAVERARKAASRVESHPEFDGSHCVDCGIDIPTARLNLGKVRCVDCQGRLEKSKNRS